jgi:hypothetical protein
VGVLAVDDAHPIVPSASGTRRLPPSPTKSFCMSMVTFLFAGRITTAAGVRV